MLDPNNCNDRKRQDTTTLKVEDVKPQPLQ